MKRFDTFLEYRHRYGTVFVAANLRASKHPIRRIFPLRTGSAVALLAVFAILSLAVYSSYSPDKTNVSSVPTAILPVNESIGVLTEKTPCLWSDERAVPKAGERIGLCELHLLEGIAAIDFDRNVSLYIEGPAHLSLTHPNRCFLYSGKVLAEVQEEGIGFTVDTHTASIEDRGTRFGVQVLDGKTSEIQVFSGQVDVRPAIDNAMISLTTGKRVRFLEGLPEDSDKRAGLPGKDDGGDYIRTTADGAGKETSIVIGGGVGKLDSEFISKSETFTLVKNSLKDSSSWHRKAYFTIDLGNLPSSTFQDVVLELAFSHSGIGFLSRAAKVSQLSVYGLIDETGDFWDENTIDWSSAPANLSGPAELDLTKVMMLGQIQVASNDIEGIKTISGNALRRFVEMDTNRLLTFIVVCETKSSKKIGYAYGFANRHHPELPAPTLRFMHVDPKDSGDPGEAE